MDQFVDDRAMEDEEEDEESIDEETGEPKRRANGHDRGAMDDSSEEEEDDDEEAAREVAAGFIDDEDEEDLEARRERRRERKKRRREEREREDEGLDEEDLELIGIKTHTEDAEPKFKRLKRGPREERDARTMDVNDIFGASDDEAEPVEQRKPGRLDRHAAQDEFDDFIEDDVFSDEEQQRQREDEEIARPRRRGLADLSIAEDAGLDEQAMEDFREAFGDGHDYDFALEAEDDEEKAEQERDRNLDLKDVFEPSQLAEKLLTDEDNLIRHTDAPERHQIARKAYKDFELSEADFKEEASWISSLLWQKKQLLPDLLEPFRRAVAQVLEFLVHDDFEVPFIFQNRKDYLIHAVRRPVGRNEDGTPRMELDAHKLLNQNDLWAVFNLDLKFRALVEKRRSIAKTFDDIKSTGVASDAVFEEMLPKTTTVEEAQDLQDYLHFQYASQIKDIALTATNGQANGSNVTRRKAATTTIYEEIRASSVYAVVKAFGISAEAFARNVTGEGMTTYAEDATETPENMADQHLSEDFSTGTRALKAARSMFSEEMVHSPKLRSYLRRIIYTDSVIDCFRTDKGMKAIREDSDNYEFKYLRNQTLANFANKPDLYLKMLKAEEDGLVEVKLRLRDPARLKKDLCRHIVTDAYSSIADAWNEERRNAVSSAVDKIVILMARNVKENLKNECEDSIALECRDEFSRKLDQAPYQPRGMKKGTVPRVLALSLGDGTSGRDPVMWAYVSDDGRVLENGKYTELAPGNEERSLPDGKDVAALVEVVLRREPEVIAVSGWSPETRRLISNLEEIVKTHNLRGPTYPDEDDRDRSDPLEVILVNDEVARQWRTSKRAKEAHPGLPELTLYCVGLAKYLQDPLKEYASLGKDLSAITFLPTQKLLPEDKLKKAFETSLVDYVNMVGVDLDEASVDAATANLLPFVAGLGPRKAAHLIKAYNMSSSENRTRESLILSDNPPLTAKVWSNAASTLYLRFEQTDDGAEFLDSTRIHPEDYDIARKMAADALELDEEDIEIETKEYGAGAIVRRLIKEDAQDRVNDLVLDEYADQLEKDYNAKKRSTLENIRAELNDPYEEIRSPFLSKLSESEIFTLLTGETRDTLCKGMNTTVKVRRVTEASVEGKLDCGVDAFAMEGETTDNNMNPRSLYAPHQAILANIISVDRKNFMVMVSLREEKRNRPFRRFDTDSLYNHDEWDTRQEANDRKVMDTKTDATGRPMRVIKHPLFRTFNSKQAEEYLGSMNRGDLVIRPSSKGHDHLAVTWKVADGVFQHIDVLELDKENEFTLGRTLRVGGKYNYSDLDELIVLHVKAMARKVEEMMGHEKFQDKSKSQLDEWLQTYSAANPKRAIYQFCINRERPGAFHLCFKAGQTAKLVDWAVKVIPQGFQLMGQPYPDMLNLCNGFKLIHKNMTNAAAAMGPRR